MILLACCSQKNERKKIKKTFSDYQKPKKK